MSNHLHNEVLNFLESYRKRNPNLLYWLRERNVRNKLDNGYWFQGNDDYAFVGLYNRGGGSNMTRSIGLVFTDEGDGVQASYLELVYNEERDPEILDFYRELRQEFVDFEQIAETKFRYHFAAHGEEAAINFFDNDKPRIDEMIRRKGLENLFINKEDFNWKLEKAMSMRNKQTEPGFPHNKIEELKRRYTEFKKDAFYNERITQLGFVPFAKQVIEQSLQKKLSNELFTGLIQILKHNATLNTVNSYIDRNIDDEKSRQLLKEQFAAFGFTGFTGAGRNAIIGLSDDQLKEVQLFLQECSALQSIADAADRIEAFDQLEIPMIKSGVYSPWLYYLNPSVFPIKNNSHTGFLKWCEAPADSYSKALILFHEVAEILGEKELGLVDAFTHVFSEDDELKPHTAIQKTSIPQNTILYGPPGTGKTYNTIGRAISIINPAFDLTGCSRQQAKKEYDRLVANGQIEFVTFHQSMSYEDFVEGIKPVEPKEDDEFLKYEIKDGIFKRLCERAASSAISRANKILLSDDELAKANFYKISLGNSNDPDDDGIYEWCIKNGYAALGWGRFFDFKDLSETEIQQLVPASLGKFEAQAVNRFIHYVQKGDILIVSYGNYQFRAIGRVTGDYEFKTVEGLQVRQFRKVDWLWSGTELSYEEIYDRQFAQPSIYKLDKKGIRENFFSGVDAVDSGSRKYVLIIDEINRGNVSQIFGELITLLEEDKRSGNAEALSIVLPYSKRAFAVPANLHIIGTMNTADRSIEALDTALRRRFVFHEIQPEKEQLHPKAMICRYWNDPEHIDVGYDDWLEEPYKSKTDAFLELIGMTRELEEEVMTAEYEEHDRIYWRLEDLADVDDNQFTGVRLDRLLGSINERLSALISRDHTIGHAWLMGIYGEDALKAVFTNKIIPLLQEYFYNDYAKIGLVLGKGFVKTKAVTPDIFADFPEAIELAGEYAEKTLYTIADPATLTLDDFKAIYARKR